MLTEPIESSPSMHPLFQYNGQNWDVLCEKVPNVLSPCRTWPRPPFFWFDTDFLDIFGVFLFFEKSVSFQKSGMTTTQDIRNLFT